MVADAVGRLAESGAAKLRHLETNPLGFWVASMLAGAYALVARPLRPALVFGAPSAGRGEAGP